MPFTVGIDLSSHTIDLVRLDENSATAEWVRAELTGETAWERAVNLRENLYDALPNGSIRWFEDVYLVATETPVNDQRRVLRLIQGAVIASLPAKLRQPHSCWDVHPSTWKAGLGLKGKPDNEWFFANGPGGFGYVDWDQNARDAYCLALWARDTNARAIAAALETDAA